jgi:hypothetical protein
MANNGQVVVTSRPVARFQRFNPDQFRAMMKSLHAKDAEHLRAITREQLEELAAREKRPDFKKEFLRQAERVANGQTIRRWLALTDLGETGPQAAQLYPFADAWNIDIGALFEPRDPKRPLFLNGRKRKDLTRRAEDA